VKHQIIREYARRYRPAAFIETGTYLGGTVDAVKDLFGEVYTIELDEKLHARAVQKFRRSRRVTVLRGDSSEVLPELLMRIQRPCLFWLDGHFSGGITARGKHETPIRVEMETILNHPVKGHVILIDDAREFGKNPEYPTLSELRSLVRAHDERLVFEVWNDVIRIHH
jgi:hypothetical protein